ncbi:MAG TPA: TAXI family TRAP transporter solute-binding subunit, partial [Myxococcaceae bacterium]
DPEASLRHLKVGFLSGSVKGNYFAVVDRIAVGAARRKGHVTNLTSAGSVENLRRLIEARSSCSAHFALVQEGTPLPVGSPLELIGRLTRPESLVVLGRNADQFSSLRELHGLRLGIGPEGSGTESLMRRLLAPLASLDLQVFTQPIDEQLQKLERGELDLGAMVIDEDAEQLRDAVRLRKLQLLDLPRAEAVAHELPFLRVARLEPGHYDVLSGLPPTPKSILQTDTLVVGNGCASRSATQAVITLFTDTYPRFLNYNRESANLSGLAYAPGARSYYATGEPDLLGVYAPRVIDIMPTAGWIQLALGISVLFNAMGLVNRFRLWRLDDARVKMEQEIPRLFHHPRLTVAEIARSRPAPGREPEEVDREVRSLIDRLGALYGRCRRQSVSILVPMGGEMAYRYQETLIADLIQALRDFADRGGAAATARADSSAPPRR